MPTIYGPVDLIKNELRNVVIQNLGAAPPAPLPGQLYYDTGSQTLYFYDGTTWVAASAGAGGPPTGPAGGGLAGVYPNPTIAAGAVANAQIVDVAWAKVTGAPASLPPSGAAGGDLTGTYPAPTLNPAALAPYLLRAGGTMTGALILAGAPVGANEAATKSYVDSAINGLSWKDTVHLASTGNLPLNGLAAIDGVVPAVGDRILAKNQTTAQQNGIYLAAAGAWATAPDWQSQGDVLDAAVFVSAGTANADTAWVMTTDAPITVGTTPLAWSQFGAGASYTAGNGLTLAANQFSAVAGTGISVTAGININFAGTGAAATASRSDHDHNATYAVLTRLINTTAPLTGGGDLSADRTLGITNFTAGAAGAVPASAGGTVNFLRADGTWIAPPAAIGGNGLTGTGTLDVVAGDTTITVAVNDIRVNTAVIATVASVNAAVLNVTKKYAAAVAGNASPEIVTHSLGTQDITVQVRDGSQNAIAVDWDATSATTVTIRYTPNLPAGSRIVVVG